MRFSITYDIKGIPELPLDYRGGFVTLIRSALDKGNSGQPCKDIFVKYPSCFAIRFDRKPEIKDGRFLIGRNIRLYISTPSFLLGTAIYNGLLSIKNFSLYNTEIEKRSILYINERNIQDNTVAFATLSPIIIRNHLRRNRYVLPGEEGFEESLSSAFCEQWKLYNDISLDSYGNPSTKILKYKKVVMTHYGGLLLGFTGVLQMKALPNILKFFYQSGIGYRRRNGFGFVEVDY